MKKIGILSDTHAYWDDRYATFLEGCDEIWHAGDVGSYEILERLSKRLSIKILPSAPMRIIQRSNSKPLRRPIRFRASFAGRKVWPPTSMRMSVI